MSESMVDAVPETDDDAVRILPAAHDAGDPAMDVFCVLDPQHRVVRLIEVSDAFPEGGVDRPVPPNSVERVVPVFPMGPARDFPFRSEIAQVTSAEWRDLRRGHLKLNRDWGDLTLARQVLRAD